MDSRTTWPALIGALVKGETLTSDEAAWAMNEIMEGAASPACEGAPWIPVPPGPR